MFEELERRRNEATERQEYESRLKHAFTGAGLNKGGGSFDIGSSRAGSPFQTIGSVLYSLFTILSYTLSLFSLSLSYFLTLIITILPLS